MKIGLVQYAPEWEAKKDSIEKINVFLSEAEKDLRLLIFPEMTLTGFSMNPSVLGEQCNGGSAEYFASLARERACHVFAGIIESEDGIYYNTLLHITDFGVLRAKYRKIHPFSFSKEDRYYSAGESECITEIDGIRFGLSICYDLRFPELFRRYGKARVHAVVNIANWPVPRIHHYRALLKARSIENLCYAIGVNRTGADPFVSYNGYSSAFDPLGEEIIVVAGSEGIFPVEIIPERVEKMQAAFPFLNDIKLF